MEITLATAPRNIAEGRYKVKVTDITYDKDFDLFDVTYETIPHQIVHHETYRRLKPDGSTHFQYQQFTAMARACLGVADNSTINTDNLINKVIDVEIKKREYTNKNGELKSVYNISRFCKDGELVPENQFKATGDINDIPF